MEDGYLFSAAKRIVVMQTLQAAAEAVFQGMCEQSSCRALGLSIAGWVGLLLTVAY